VVFGKEAPHYRNTKQILARVGACEQRACFDMLVKLGIWDEDENLLLQRHGISHTWPDSVTEQMEALGKADLLKTVKDKQRKDLTHLQTFSIDEPFTRDIDDAISFEFHKDFLQLGIHVTDAASLIHPGSPLDKESARRGASLYLPNEKVPMLPQTLSEKMLSLMKGKRRPAISFLINLSLKGEMLDFKSILSVIRVSEKLSYNEVDVDIEKGGRFLRLYNLVSSLRKRRTESGATWVLIPELQVRLDRKKKVVLTIRDKESPSQVLVSESMILANHCAALLFIEKQFPALYRKQAAPSKKIDSGTRPSLFQLFSQRRKFSRVEVDVTPGPHSSLGLSSYTSITSPLRKHLDLVTQRQLVSLIKDEAPVYNRKELKNIASSVLSMLTKASIVDQERKRYWLLKVLRNRVGEELKALVINFRFGVYNIILLDYLLDVILKVPEGIFISPGDIVSVMIKSVDPFAGTSKVELPG
jgi:exoribonuclease-2